MEYGCVFVMKHRQGLSGKVLSLQQQQGMGGGRPDPSVRGTSPDWHRDGREGRDPRGLSLTSQET